jgi:fibronectin-binding autotransporter adhesin
VAVQAACVGVIPSYALPPGNVATWTGGAGTGSWSGTSNWITPNGSGKPTTSGTWSLLFGGTTQTTNTNDIGTITLGTMSFTNNGTSGQTATFTLSGSTLALSNGSIVTTATSGGSLTDDVVANALTLTGSNVIQLGRGHSLSLTTGGISGVGSLTIGGDATLYLSASNAYSGNTYVTGAQVRTAANGVADGSNNYAFGTGNVIVSGSGSVVLRNATTLANNFTIGGMGLSSSGTLGAIRGSFSTSSRTATVSGSVALSANAMVATGAGNGVTDSQLTLSGPVNLGSSVLTLAPDLAVTNTTSASIVLSGPISGSGSVVVLGQSQSRVLLSGSSGYTGGTKLTSGTLAVGNANALGTGSLAVNDGALDLNGQSLSVGTLSGSAGGLISSSVGGAASLSVNQTADLGFAGSIQNGSGVVSLSKSGTGILYMSGSSSYTGTTTVTDGQIRTAASGVTDGFNNNAFGTGNVLVSGSGSVVLRNATTLANNFSIGGMGLSTSGTQGAIRGSFSTSSRTASISGTVTLTANATIATAASNGITGGQLTLSGPVNLGSSVLTLAPDLAVTNTTSASIVLSGPISGSGSVVVLGQSQSRVLLSGSSGYTGGTKLTSGTLAVGNANALGTGSLAVNGGVLDLNGQALSVGTLSGSSGGLVTSSVAGAASLNVNQTGNAEFAGSIQNGSGVVGLAKSGVGILYMSGSNSYSGDTTVTSGQIRTAGNGVTDGSNNYAFGSGNVIVSGSGSVALRNATALSNNFTIGGAGVYGSGTQGAIRGSFSTSNRTASISGAVTLAADATIATAASASITGSKLLLSGPMNLGSHTLTFSPGAAGPEPFSRTSPTAAPIVVTGTMTGSGNVVVDGLSSVYINGSNASTGSTTVRAGTLGGNGSIAGAVIVQNGGFIDPGSAANTTGALSVGSLQLNSGATAAMAISGTAAGLYDQIVAVNNVTYGGALAIDFTTGGFANFDVWQLFSGSSHSGHFSSVAATGSYGSLTFNYLGNGEWQATGGSLGAGESLSFYEDNSHAIGNRYAAGQLVLVPEPSTIVFAGIGLIIAGWRGWAHRRARGRAQTEMVSASA